MCKNLLLLLKKFPGGLADPPICSELQSKWEEECYLLEKGVSSDLITSVDTICQNQRAEDERKILEVVVEKIFDGKFLFQFSSYLKRIC